MSDCYKVRKHHLKYVLVKSFFVKKKSNVSKFAANVLKLAPHSKVVLVGRRQSGVIIVNNLYLIKQNLKRKNLENILLELTVFDDKIPFLCKQMIPFC